jgi:uncharacterized protein
LASRFPYGREITAADLEMVEAAERRLRELGFAVCRVRHHGRLARVEVPLDDLARAIEASVRRAIVASLRELGYAYVTIDMEGFRSGSLNEVLETSSQADATTTAQPYGLDRPEGMPEI